MCFYIAKNIRYINVKFITKLNFCAYLIFRFILIKLLTKRTYSFIYIFSEMKQKKYLKRGNF